MEYDFAKLAHRLEMEWRLVSAARMKRLAVFVSRADHALLELLWRQHAGDLRAKMAAMSAGAALVRREVTGKLAECRNPERAGERTKPHDEYSNRGGREGERELPGAAA